MPNKETMERVATYVVEQRRAFHRIPELSGKEEKTSAAIRAQLEEMGIPYDVVGDYGVVARVEGKQPGDKIAIRADIDALPMQEEADVPFRSQHDGVAHTCGHDGHIAVLLATGKYLSENKDSFSGTVYLCFQQAEEVGTHHEFVVNYLKEVGISTVLSSHLWADIPVGKISLRHGTVMAGTTSFRINIKGSGCHGSRPDQGIDPLNAGVSLVGDVMRLKDREVSPLTSATLSFGLFNAGTATNIIPNEANLGGTMRFATEEVRSHLLSLIDRASKATAQLTRCEVNWNIGVGLPPCINNDEVIKAATPSAARVFGAENVFEFDQIMASDNFGCYLAEFPGVYAFIGVGNPDKGACYPHHHPKFNMDEDALAKAVAFYVDFVETNL